MTTADFDRLLADRYVDATAERLGRELDEKSEHTVKRLERKARGVRELLDGRRTLRETVRAFQEIDRAAQFRSVRRHRLAPPCQSEEEYYGRAVFEWAHAELTVRPWPPGTLHRLECELEDLLQSNTTCP